MISAAHCSVLLKPFLSFAAFGWAASTVNAPASLIEASSSEQFTVRQFVIEGNTLVARDRLLGSLKQYVGDAKDAATLKQAREAVLRTYREAGYQMVSVVALPSDGPDGFVRLRVHETWIGKVSFFVGARDGRMTCGGIACIQALALQVT